MSLNQLDITVVIVHEGYEIPPLHRKDAVKQAIYSVYRVDTIDLDYYFDQGMDLLTILDYLHKEPLYRAIDSSEKRAYTQATEWAKERGYKIF
ncbi:hypothetical protein EI42_04726 [Thermosporothrix hazakensis]|jgi:hypothetical protein|uniref:Uncharacterized protein n=2 Tax=Thermosporothrix TaxID=768650 RepID=A0A326UDH7_THEHA|nr:hypothetical protein [Thermosporothrix hazakensis]PZW24035.1 hypothetical protein EI42_04726 [Thermosporothrix hazakensis]BBH87823.1 hypothetical protein KTC_25740 [Thermosporothrix sp. COM3]GCE50251.1 hypothetical protein KTH_51200 [Thermosporothrix hazakensis]